MKPFAFFHSKLAIFSFSLLALYVILALFASFGWTTYDFAATSTDVYQSPSLSHWLGTDLFGRDIFARAVQGIVIALSVGVVSSVIAISIGTLLGALAGYFGGRIEAAIVWLYTTWDSIPYILLLASFAWVLGKGLINLYLALGLTCWVTTCRLVRMEVIKQKQRDYVTAGRAFGFSDARILIHHILPNIMPLLLVQFGLCFVLVVKIEVILSFLNLGVEPGTPSWGLMIDDGKQEVAKGFWWNILAGTGFMFGLVLAINLLIESVREHINPYTRN